MINYNGFELESITFKIYEDGQQTIGVKPDGSLIQLGSVNAYKITDDKTPIKVFTNELDYKKYNWCKSWKELEEKEQLLIWAMFGKEWILDQYKNDFEKLKTPEKLRSSAYKNFYRMGWNKPCTRCGGSGHYSYNMRYGSRCFKCEGNKIQLTVPTKAELNKFLKKWPEGLINIDKDDFYEIKGKGEYKLKRKDKEQA